MINVGFYEEVEDYQWIFCKHKNGTTYECSGGHREEGEAVSRDSTKTDFKSHAGNG